MSRRVNEACEQIGFLVVSGHGVPAELIDEMYQISREFFDLPVEQKMDAMTPPDVFRGYQPVAVSTLARGLDITTPPDLKESFTIGPLHVADNEYYRRPEGLRFFDPTPWPEAPIGFREVSTKYYLAMEDLATRLMRIFAVALDLGEHAFDDKIHRHISNFQVINYPSQPQAPVPGQLRAGEHSDYGSLTILVKDEGSSGLQVHNRAGDWVDVTLTPGTFIVNIGDLMAQWTNDRWVSTVHRVVNPPRDEAASSRRISIVFFHQPNYDAVIEPLVTCTGPDNPPRYEPVTSGEHLLMKLRKTISK